MASFEVSVPHRGPFQYGPVSPIMAFRRFGLASGVKPIRNLSKFMVKVWCRWLGFPLRGSFGLQLDGQVTRINVSSHNSHFETVLAWPLGSYEPAVGALIDRFLPDDGTFYDIGANWGYYALYAASRPGYNGQVHAFEPYPPTAADLEAVLAQVGLGNMIVAHNMALSNRTGEARMVVPQRVKAAQASIREHREDGLAVPTAPLDGLGLPNPDMIKLDVEGHEAMVLEGARDTLRRSKPVIVFENWVHPARMDKTLAPVRLLEELGFRIYAPLYDASPSGADGRLRLHEISSKTRADFPEIVDVCAIHPDRLDAMKADEP